MREKTFVRLFGALLPLILFWIVNTPSTYRVVSRIWKCCVNLPWTGQ